VSYTDIKQLADRALCLSTAAEVRSFIEEKIVGKFPQILSP